MGVEQVQLSAVVITYNEEANIERCLASLEFADEIVVLDSNSTDRTREIARRFTDRISCREFKGYSEQKAAAVAMASNEWVLVVDADEVITAQLAAEIRSELENPSYDAYRIPRLSEFVGRRMRHGGWYPDYQLRLARKSKIEFPHRLVHETMVVDGDRGTLTNDMLHYTYPTLADYFRKTVAYSSLAARQKMIEGRNFCIADLIFNPGFRFVKRYFLQQGFRDGLHGLVLSVLTACGSALRYAMLWEMSVQKKNDKENQ